MASPATDPRAEFLEKLNQQVGLRLAEPECDRVREFAGFFYERIAMSDLEDRNAEDDASLLISTWKRFQKRDTDKVQIQVANPVHARDGWQSRHTTVWLMSRDMPFIVDSVLIALSHNGQVTHHLNNVVLGIDRNEVGEIEDLTTDIDHPNRELLLYAEVDRLTDEDLPELQQRLRETIQDLQAAVGDFAAMSDKLSQAVATSRSAVVPNGEVAESMEFLDWLSKDNFTFLGFREFEYAGDCIRQVGDPLGVLRVRGRASERRLSEQTLQTRGFLLEVSLLAFSKGGTRTRVHRPESTDYVGVRRFY